MNESGIRYYDKKTGERVSHTLKVDELKKQLNGKSDEELPIFIWNVDNEDGRYKKVDSRSVFDNEEQLLIPSHVLPVQPLSHETYWEIVTNEIGDQELFESVTSLLNMFSKDGVVQWQHNEKDKYLFSLMKNQYGIEQGVIDSLRQDLRFWEPPMDAAERGTRWHSATERWLKGEDWEKALLPTEVKACAAFFENMNTRLTEWFGDYKNLVTERNFVCDYIGIAGQADLLLMTIDNQDVVIDFKFSDKPLVGARGTLLTGKFCFPERAMQLAMYALGLKIENPMLVNVFGNTEDGSCELYQWEDPMKWMESAALAVMLFYRMKLGKYPQSEGGKIFELTIASFLESYFNS